MLNVKQFSSETASASKALTISQVFFYTSLFLITLMIAEPFWFFSLLKIHLASQLVRLSLNLRMGRCVDEGTGHGTLVASLCRTITASPNAAKTKTHFLFLKQRLDTSAFAAHPPRALRALDPCQEILHFHRTAFISLGLFHQGNLCFMVAIPLPASDWKFNRQALEMVSLALSRSYTPATVYKGNGSLRIKVPRYRSSVR